MIFTRGLSILDTTHGVEPETHSLWRKLLKEEHLNLSHAFAFKSLRMSFALLILAFGFYFFILHITHLAVTPTCSAHVRVAR